jgi:hypothetical protein
MQARRRGFMSKRLEAVVTDIVGGGAAARW